MAETRNRSESGRDSAQALQRRDRERGALQRQPSGNWFSDSFDFMDRVSEEMDQVFDRVFRDFGVPRRASLSRSPFRSADRQSLWLPRVEAFQKGDRFIVRAELPGLKKEDIQVDVRENAINIHGERKEEHQEEREGFYHTEREYGEFYRTIPLPDGVIADSAQASFKNGVLEIAMQAPPAEATRGRRIEIKDTPEAGEKK